MLVSTPQYTDMRLANSMVVPKDDQRDAKQGVSGDEAITLSSQLKKNKIKYMFAFVRSERTRTNANVRDSRPMLTVTGD